MKILFCWFVMLGLMSPILAASNICTRDYGADGYDICTTGQSRYKYVQTENAERPTVCVTAWADTYCKNQKKEFTHALGVDGKPVCVLNYNQAETGNYCVADPKRYVYVKDPWGA